jgi:hypothetical protein
MGASAAKTYSNEKKKGKSFSIVSFCKLIATRFLTFAAKAKTTKAAEAVSLYILA